MEIKTPVRTAKIFEFPRRPASLAGRRVDAMTTDQRMQRVGIADFDSWYHQAAVEADRVRKP